jgi:hypothetical protein
VNDRPAYEMTESTVAPGTWGWALWTPAGKARACVAARQGFDSPAEALKSLQLFKAAAASEVVIRSGKADAEEGVMMTFDQAVELLDAKLPAAFIFDLVQQAGRHGRKVSQVTTLEVRSAFDAKRFTIDGPDFGPAARAGVDWAKNQELAARNDRGRHLRTTTSRSDGQRAAALPGARGPGRKVA